MTGYSRAELLGKPVRALLLPDVDPDANDLADWNTPQPLEVVGLRKDGSTTPYEIQTKTICYCGQELRVLAMRDISYRKTLEGKARQLETENLSLRAIIHERSHLGALVGSSPIMNMVYARIVQAAASDETVIIYGETGAGKELAAHAVYELSPCRASAFVPVNCTAIPETLFEAQFFGHRRGAFTGASGASGGLIERARGGVLFLDEVGDLPLTMQAKLLRLLNDKTYTPLGATDVNVADVRIIAATNKDLRQLVQTGAVRADFFHRLHVITLHMPPLREHTEDIPELIAHFLRQHTQSSGRPAPELPEALRDQLLAYDWPGNVRELYNVLRRYLTTGEVQLGDPRAVGQRESGQSNFEGRPFNAVMCATEAALVRQAMQRAGGNKTKAAALLGIPARSLYRLLKRHNLQL